MNFDEKANNLVHVSLESSTIAAALREAYKAGQESLSNLEDFHTPDEILKLMKDNFKAGMLRAAEIVELSTRRYIADGTNGLARRLLGDGVAEEIKAEAEKV